MTSNKRQATMAEAFTRKARRVAEEDAQVVSAVPMVEAAKPLHNKALFDVNLARIETLQGAHLQNYLKHVQDESADDMSVHAGATWCVDGLKFVQGLEEFEAGDTSFPSSVTAQLAEVVSNHGRHTLPDLSARAALLLDRILARQPPATVKWPAAAAAEGDGSYDSGITLRVQQPDLEVWAGLPPAGKPAEAIVLLSSARTARSAAVTNPLGATRSQKVGMRWLVPQLENALLLLHAMPDEAHAATARRKHLGAVMLMQHVTKVMGGDLAARVQVVQGHMHHRKQQKLSQLMLAESLLFRFLQEGGEADLSVALTSIWHILVKAAGWTAATDLPAAAPEHHELVEAVRHVAGSFLRQVLTLLGAMEDVGAFVSSTSVCPSNLKRHHVDVWLTEWLAKQRAAPAWHAVLTELPPRDRMRTLSMLLAIKYVNMDYDDSKVEKHGARFLHATATKFGGKRTDVPATYLNIPPASVMQLLTHEQLLKKFYCTVFQRRKSLLCTFAHHLCIASAAALRALLADHRFTMVDRLKTLAALRDDAGTAFADTYLRLNTGTHVPQEQFSAAVQGELEAIKGGLHLVCQFIGTISSKGDGQSQGSQDTPWHSEDENYQGASQCVTTDVADDNAALITIAKAHLQVALECA